MVKFYLLAIYWSFFINVCESYMQSKNVFDWNVRKHTTKYCVNCHQFYLPSSMLHGNHPCSVINTKREPNSNPRSLWKKSYLKDLQCCNSNYCHLLSGFSSRFWSSVTKFHYKMLGCIIYHLLEVDELKVSQNDNTCELIDEK